METADTVETSKPVIVGVGAPPSFDGTAILRFKSAVAKPSRSEKPMIECKFEIIKPEFIDSPFDGKRYMLDSAELMGWILLWDLDKNGKILQNGLTWLNEVLLPGVLGIEQTFNPAAPLFHEEKNPTGVKLEGLCFEGIVKTEERIEQRRLPNGQYETLKDMQGNPIKRGWQWKTLDIGGILRRAEVETNRAF